MSKTVYDAVVVGSGPNGLAAAILLKQQGLSVLLIEANEKIGGGLSTAELTLPGFIHDPCSAIHPMAKASPFFTTLPLSAFGLEYINPKHCASHPLDGGRAVLLQQSFEATAHSLGRDESVYRSLMEDLVKNWDALKYDILAPFHFPKNPIQFASFGLKALKSATSLARRFKTEEAKALFAGMAAHSIQPLNNLATSAIAMVLLAVGHKCNWPIPKGGSYQIAKALADYFLSIGGEIKTGWKVKNLNELPAASVTLLDLTPKQLIEIGSDRFPKTYLEKLSSFRYGMGVFKIDFALNDPIPFTNQATKLAGTVHIGNSLEEIAASEFDTFKGQHAQRPFVLLAQQSIFDSSRAPDGKHTAWAYCHVPNGSTYDMTAAIENQIERFAPGFKDTILAKHVFNTKQLEELNANNVGGDINGGSQDIRQLFTRPLARFNPYSTPAKGIYICSSSTPPGGGVHGMCGYHAARSALKEIFHLDIDKQ